MIKSQKISLEMGDKYRFRDFGINVTAGQIKEMLKVLTNGQLRKMIRDLMPAPRDR